MPQSTLSWRAVFAVGRLLANMPAGQLADTFGRKAMLVWGPALTAGGMLMSGMSGSYIELLCWRLVTGVGSSMQMTGSQLFLGDISQKSNRARIMGTNQAAALLGLSIGPALGGVLATEVSLAAPFTVTAGLAALAALYGQFRLPETHPVLTRRVHESSREGSDPTPGALESGEREKAETEKDVTGRGGEAQQSRWDLVKGLLRNPKFLAILSVNTTLFLSTNGSRGVLMPLYTANALHWNTAEVRASTAFQRRAPRRHSCSFVGANGAPEWCPSEFPRLSPGLARRWDAGRGAFLSDGRHQYGGATARVVGRR